MDADAPYVVRLLVDVFSYGMLYVGFPVTLLVAGFHHWRGTEGWR